MYPVAFVVPERVCTPSGWTVDETVAPLRGLPLLSSMYSCIVNGPFQVESVVEVEVWVEFEVEAEVEGWTVI